MAPQLVRRPGPSRRPRTGVEPGRELRFLLRRIFQRSYRQVVNEPIFYHRWDVDSAAVPTRNRPCSLQPLKRAPPSSSPEVQNHLASYFSENANKITAHNPGDRLGLVPALLQALDDILALANIF